MILAAVQDELAVRNTSLPGRIPGKNKVFTHSLSVSLKSLLNVRFHTI